MEAMLAKTLFTTAATGAVTVGGVLSAAGTGMSLLSAVQSGQQQQASYNMQAQNAMIQQQGVQMQMDAEKNRAREEGNLRRERLLNALAAQNVRAGAAGVKGGSVEALRLESSEAFEREQRSADLMSKYQQDQYASQSAGYGYEASAKRAQGKTARSSSLLSLGTTLASIG